MSVYRVRQTHTRTTQRLRKWGLAYGQVTSFKFKLYWLKFYQQQKFYRKQLTENKRRKNNQKERILKINNFSIYFPPFYFVEIQLIKMQSIRKLNIFQLYRKLPFIILKDTYLLPQFPALPQKLMNKQVLTNLKQILNIGQSKSNLKMKDIPSISEQQLAKSKREMQNYVNNYLALTNQPKQNLICLKRFYQENKSHITEKRNGKGIITYKDLLQIFKSFPKVVRTDYQRRAKEDYLIQMEIFNQFQQLHKIPSLKIETPKQVYYKLMQNQQNKNYPKFYHLTKKQKQIYDTAYLIASQQIMNNFQTFLKSYNMTKEEFDIILQVCNKKKEYTELILTIKNNMLLIKKGGIESQLASEQLGQNISQAANLFKLSQTFSQDMLNKYERLFEKAKNKKFQLPPLVDWNYQKSQRKCYNIPKAPIKFQKEQLQTVTQQIINQPIKSAESTPLQKPVSPSNFPPKADIETQNRSVLIPPDSESILDQKKANEGKIEKLPNSNNRNAKEKTSTEQDFEYDSLDDQQPKHFFRSPNDELYDLDDFGDHQGFQIIKNYDKVRYKIVSKYNK